MRKLTKAQWFEAAWYWEQTGRDRSDGEFIWDARCAAKDAVEHMNDGFNRWLMYSQFCCEKAGLA